MFSLSPQEVRERVAAAHVLERAELTQITEDAQLRADTPLPGWTLAHVLASRLVFLRAALRQIQYALAGETIAFYRTGPDPRTADRRARDEELAVHAVRPAAELVGEVRQATVVLDDAFTRLGDADWARPARYRGRGDLGDVLLAAWRECQVHRIDYGLGVRPRDWPQDLCEHMLEYLARRVPDRRTLIMRTPDGQVRRLGSGPETVELRGELTDLAAWLGGRAQDGPVTLPDGSPAPGLDWLRERRPARVG